MKKLIIRSVRVILILALISLNFGAICFISKWYMLLMLLWLIPLDATDSMIVWRLKRISKSNTSPFVLGYIIITGVSLAAFYYECYNNMDNPSMITYCHAVTTLFSGLVSIFFFRYLIIIARVLERNFD